MCETQHNNADLDCFKTPILQETWKTQTSTSGGLLHIFGSHTFYANKLDVQETDSHSLTDAELKSLDEGLCMDGIPALDRWDLVVKVFIWL